VTSKEVILSIGSKCYSFGLEKGKGSRLRALEHQLEAPSFIVGNKTGCWTLRNYQNKVVCSRIEAHVLRASIARVYSLESFRAAGDAAVIIQDNSAESGGNTGEVAVVSIFRKSREGLDVHTFRPRSGLMLPDGIAVQGNRFFYVDLTGKVKSVFLGANSKVFEGIHGQHYLALKNGPPH
jgi:hypothetical protein